MHVSMQKNNNNICCMKFYIHIYIIVYLKCLKGTHTRILIYILHMCIYIYMLCVGCHLAVSARRNKPRNKTAAMQQLL